MKEQTTVAFSTPRAKLIKRIIELWISKGEECFQSHTYGVGCLRGYFHRTKSEYVPVVEFGKPWILNFGYSCDKRT